MYTSSTEGIDWMPTMKVREVIHMIEADGWKLDRQRGSHRQYRHQIKPGQDTIAGKPTDTLDPGTLRNIFRQAQLDWPPQR
jgi:predicted RNA binding protein YcfA (HicA-like mRNA interferase family)